MPVTGDGSLKWVAEIATQKLEQGVKRINQAFGNMADKQGTESEKMKKSISSLEIKLESYRRISQKTLDPKILVEYNQEIQRLEKSIQQLKNVGKAGFDEMGNAVKGATSGLGGMVTIVKSLMASLGIVFGVQQLLMFAKELFGIAKKAEGIELAFSRIATAADLENLRKQTRGTLSDLDLMAASVRASNFSIPLDVLGKGLAFAQQRAKDTGQEVDYLVNSLVDGLGRKSALKIDNLGISLSQIQAELRTTTDFATAIGNILEREMAKSGDAVETLGEKTNQLAASWDNALTSVGKFFRELGNPTGADTAKVASLTESIATEAGATLKQLEKLTKGQLDSIDYVLTAQRDALKEQKIIEEARLANPYLRKEAQKRVKEISEEIIATQNVLSNVQQQNKALAEQERIRRNILSASEMMAKAEKLREDAKIQIIRSDDDQKLVTQWIKEAEEWERKANEILGKGIEAREKKEESAYQKSLRLRESLLQQINKLDDEYSRKGLTREEQEKQAIIDRFKLLKYEVTQFNKTAPKGLQIGTAKLDSIQKQAISDLEYRQETERLKIQLTEQKRLFAEYEDYRSVFGEKAAQSRYDSELDGFKTLLDKLQNERKKLTGTGTMLSGPQQERLKDIDKLIEQEEKLELQKYIELMKGVKSFEQHRYVLIEEYQRKRNLLIAKGEDEAVKVLDRSHNEQLTALDIANSKLLENYGLLFDGIEKLSRAHAKKKLAELQADLKAQIAANTITAEAAKELQERINGIRQAISNGVTEELSMFASMLNEIASNLSGIDKGFANLVQGASRAVYAYGQIVKASEAYNNAATPEEKNAAAAELATQGINGLITVITTITNASKARKEAEQAYYNAVIEGQREYNLTLNEQLRLQAELDENVFLTDYKGRALSATEALTEANREYLKALEELQKGQAKTGQRNAVDWGAVGAAAGGGAAVGAAIGSVVPVIGTAIGAVVGAIVGGIAGLFGGKKKQDVFGGLLEEYPELILQMEDGTIKVNEALAKTLIEQNLVNEETKALIENTLEWAAAVEAAKEQIREVITNLAGSLGNDLRSALVSAFKNGEDAAKAFGDTVSGVIENILAQFLFNEIFAKNFEDLQKEMEASMGLGGDQSWVDDLARFFAEAGPNVEKYNEAMEAARIEAEKYGLDVFGKKPAEDPSKQGALAGAIKASITEDTANIMVGTLNGQRMATLQHLEVGRQQVGLLQSAFHQQQLIERNTYNTVQSLATTNQILTAQLTETNKKLAMSNQTLGSIDRKADLQSSILRALGG